MPIYEYVCLTCNEEQEKVHKMDQENKDPCIHCGAPAEDLKKVLSTTGVHSSWSKWRK